MNPTTIPMVIVPVTFLFVLLIILVAKAPKAGVWLVGGLILLAPILLWRAATAGAFSRPTALPLIIVPVTFLFVLLVILVGKAPKVGTGLIIALVIMAVLGLFLVPAISHHVTYTFSSPATPLMETESTGHGTGLVIVEDGQHMTLGLHEPVSHPPIPPQPVMPSPIWSDGVEVEFDADVYPSQLAAVRVLGSRMDRLIRRLPLDANSPVQIVLFQQEQDRDLIVELKNSIQRVLPAAACTIETEPRNVQPTEIMATLQLTDINMERAPWAKSDEVKAADGRIKVSAIAAGQSSIMQTRFVDKPWVEDFAAFTSTRPQQHFIVTRSNGTCTSESEAQQQALNDARARLTDALGRSTGWKLGKLPQPEIAGTDVLQGGFIVDRFAQSFEGSAGRIWRQALLIDASGSKLTQLAGQKARELHETKMSWARMGFSVIGVLVLIGVIYFFLNMATMGYYEWSLRIAGVVLAIVAIISILMIVQ